MSPKNRSKGRESWPPGLTRHIKGMQAYYGWVNPLTKIEKSLKATNNFPLAVQRAIQANAIVAVQLEERETQTLSDNVTNKITFKKWVEDYIISITNKDKLKPNTIKCRKSNLAILSRYIGNMYLHTVDVQHLASALQAEEDAGRARQAQQIRSTAVDLFREAMGKGLFPTNRPNPAELVYKPSPKVQRERLEIHEFNTIINHAGYDWERNVCLLALVTGQTREDLAIAQFKRGKEWDIKWKNYRTGKSKIMPHSYTDDEFYYATRQKTGALIKIPLDLRLDVINISIRDVIKLCRKTGVTSRFLIHHVVPRYTSKIGDPIWKDTISRSFKRMRTKTDLEWHMNPPTFHEIRSLSERMYKQQGVNTQLLLGHKDPRTTAIYNDNRGANFNELQINTGTIQEK